MKITRKLLIEHKIFDAVTMAQGSKINNKNKNSTCIKHQKQFIHTLQGMKLFNPNIQMHIFSDLK